MKNRRIALVVAVLFTVAAAVGFCVSVATTAASFYYRPTIESTGSGGIGAVSVGIADPFVLGTLLFVVAAVFVNVAVKQQAARADRAAVRIRRAHLAVTILTLFWPALVVLLWVLLERRGTETTLIILGAGGALVSAIHTAFGVFAMRLLRRG